MGCFVPYEKRITELLKVAKDNMNWKLQKERWELEKEPREERGDGWCASGDEVISSVLNSHLSELQELIICCWTLFDKGIFKCDFIMRNMRLQFNVVWLMHILLFLNWVWLIGFSIFSAIMTRFRNISCHYNKNCGWHRICQCVE